MTAEDLHDAIFEAIDRHSDESGVAPVGVVVEDVLDQTTANVPIVGMALHDLMVTGGVYQPNSTAVAATSVDVTPATPTYEHRVRDDGRSISYGPWDADGGDWALVLSTTEGKRLRLLLAEPAMHELWTEVQHVPYSRKPKPEGTLRREIVEKTAGMDADQLGDVLDAIEDAGGER
jgi:hypothetical protein